MGETSGDPIKGNTYETKSFTVKGNRGGLVDGLSENQTPSMEGIYPLGRLGYKLVGRGGRWGKGERALNNKKY